MSVKRKYEEKTVEKYVTEGTGKVKPSLQQLSATCYALIRGTSAGTLSAKCILLGLVTRQASPSMAETTLTHNPRKQETWNLVSRKTKLYHIEIYSQNFEDVANVMCIRLKMFSYLGDFKAFILMERRKKLFYCFGQKMSLLLLDHQALENLVSIQYAV